MKQRCLKCYVIKDSNDFDRGQKFCSACLGKKKQKTKCYRCNSYKPVSKVNEIGVCMDGLSKQIDNRQTQVTKTKKRELNTPQIDLNTEKDLLIEKMIMSAEEVNITILRTIETINFNNENYDSLRRFKMEDLKFILEDLEGIKEDLENAEQGDQQETIINPLEILEKYKDGKDIVGTTGEAETNEEWRNYIPSFIKQRIPGWGIKSLEDFYFEARELMETQTGSTLQRTREYVSELSQIVFEEKEDKVKEENVEEKTDIEASILSVVEMIILPHLEVLNKIEEQNGKILFSDIWNKPFDDGLKKDVKDRDGWRCVVCEGDTDLHVHHKIPRRLGGINHHHNLVTLCASCHKTIETADVQKAYKKCLINYRKNKASADVKKDYSTQSKAILKQEVEEILDRVIITLGNREDDQLVREISSIMDRLEIIFYD